MSYEKFNCGHSYHFYDTPPQWYLQMFFLRVSWFLPPLISEAKIWAQLHPLNLKALFQLCKASTAPSLRQAQNTVLLAIPNLWKEVYVKQTW